MMAQQQALFAEREQQHGDLKQVLDRTAKDLDQLREVHQKAIDELRLLRRWVFALKPAGGVRVAVDVDPYSFL